MAFQFPDPSVATTVVNQETGIIYQWQADPGKWVIAVNDLERYCVEQTSSTLEFNVDGQLEFYTDYEITGDEILSHNVYEKVNYIVTYEGGEHLVSELSDDEKLKIGFVEIRRDKYISQATPGVDLVGNLTAKQVVTMQGIAGDTYECISPARIIFDPLGNVGITGTVSQPLECCHQFKASPKTGTGFVIISEDPPEKDLQEGMLWFSSKETEYNLFVYCEHEGIWVPASPNVGESGAGPLILYADTAPIEDLTDPFAEGSLWIRSTDLTLFTWAKTVWAQVK